MRRSILAVFGCVLLLAGVGAGSSAITVAADFTVSADQSAMGVTVGSQALVAVTVSSVGSFIGPVSLTVAGAPPGSTVAILPNPVSLGVPAIVVVSTSSSTPTGHFNLTITATSGSLHHSVAVALTITLPTEFTMTVSPPVATVVDGASVDYTVHIMRHFFAGLVRLTLSGVPANATGTITKQVTVVASTANVHIATTTQTVPGTYRLVVHGTGIFSSATASMYLIITPQAFPPFPINGTLDRQLSPGVTGLLNLSLTNPFGSSMQVTSISVSVTSTSKPGCATSNFAVTQYSGPATLTVPAHTTKTLQQLGVAQAAWPKVGLLDLPVNQDACKANTLTLHYGAVGNGN